MSVSLPAENLFSTPLIGHAIIDNSQHIRRVNPAFARFIRYSAKELEGLHLSRVLHPSCHFPVVEELTQLRFLSRDGQVLWGDSCLLPLPAEGGDSATCFLLQVFDTTRNYLEQRLHKGRAQVLELLYRDHTLNEICDAIVHYIEALQEGVRCSILLLDPVNETLHKVSAPNLPDFFSDAIEGMKIGDGVGSCGTAVFRRERVIVADILSHPYWARARRLVERTPMRACWSEPIIANDGSVLGSFALYYDAPREPQGEELDLISSAASLTAIAIGYKRGEAVLRDLDRVKDEFISTAAHELRAPLTAIMGYAELLAADKGVPPRQLEFAEEIRHRGEALERLIGDLLDISLIQIGRELYLDRRPVSFRAVVERICQTFRNTTASHALNVSYEPGLPDLIECDAGRMTQVLENLLSNAVKYSPRGREIRVFLQRKDQWLQVTVEDEGIGMSQDALQRAFEKFYRADLSTKAPRGLGLGLALVRQIIEGHGGTVTLQSSPGVGTKVSFTLPL